MPQHGRISTARLVPPRRLTVAALALAGALATAGGAAASSLTGPGTTATFGYTGVEQTYTVPPGYDHVAITAVGAPGGLLSPSSTATPARGARVSGVLAVTAGQTLYVRVGGAGGTPNNSVASANGGAGGYNGGAPGGNGDAPSGSPSRGWAAGGGGASDVKTAAGSMASALLVAGGGGGAGSGGAGGSGTSGATGAAGGASQGYLCDVFASGSRTVYRYGGGGHGGGGGSAGAGGAGGAGGSSTTCTYFPNSHAGAAGGTGGQGAGGAGAPYNGGNGLVDGGAGGGGGGGYYGGGGGGAGAWATDADNAGTTSAQGGGGGAGGSFAASGATAVSYASDTTGTPQVTITPVTAPDAPTGVSAQGNDGSATVSFTPPAGTGGTPITGYTVTTFDDTLGTATAQTASGSAGPITVGGLTNGHSYRFRVRAANAAGTGPDSEWSSAVVPDRTDWTVTLVEHLSPAGDPGRFDLEVNGTSAKGAAGDGDSGSRSIPKGSSATISESSAAGPALSNYDVAIDCGAAGSGTGPELTITPTDDTTCTLTSTRRHVNVTLTGALSPEGDPARVDLQVDGSTVATAAGDGGSGSLEVPSGSDVTVSEESAAGPALDNYTSVIDCGGDPATGTGRTLANVTADTACTITNTRRQVTVTVANELHPAGDPGRVDLRLNGTTVKAAAGDGDSGTAQIPSGTDVTVAEVWAAGPSLAAYDSAVSCASDAGEVGTSRVVTYVTHDLSCTITNTRHADLAAPAVDITAPADGATYDSGQLVKAAYACRDEVDGSGLASCAGPVADGAAIDTATPGTHAFAVTGRDSAGNARTTTVHYTVRAPAPGPPRDTTPPQVTIGAPAEDAAYVQGQRVAVAYRCGDTGSGVARCAGPVASGARLDTRAPGVHAFTVTAADRAGNAASRSVRYVVTRARLTVAAPRSVSLKRGVTTFAVTCRLAGARLRSCAVSLRDGKVLVATGTVRRGGRGARTLTARLSLTRAGRTRLAHTGSLRVTAAAVGRTTAGTTARATGRTRVHWR